MYGPIRDLFREILGHEAGAVLNEPSVEGGRPDLTVSVPHPGADRGRRLVTIVIEAKDERGVVLNLNARNRLFLEKAKYAGFGTRWFVLIDPEGIVARPVRNGVLAAGDIVFQWEHPGGMEDFRAAFAPLAADRTNFDDLLERFRSGDLTLIAALRLDPNVDDDPMRTQFFEALGDAAITLQTATRAALEDQRPRMQELRQQFVAFNAVYPHSVIKTDPLRVTGRPQGPEETRAFRRDSSRLERALGRSPRLSRITFGELPDLRVRLGVPPDREDDVRTLDLFAAETANLILARVLLIRFFEDNGFFGPRRYVCNGGVEAVRHVLDYFAKSYTLLLRTAYEHAGTFYEAAFAESAFDWIFEDDSELLSRAVEWVLFSLSLFDFTTIRGDVLSGIYERFMDSAHRKRFGEFYTPPSIARWMLEQLDLKPGDEIFDPACGSGTFIIEAYEMLAGEPNRRGFGTWEDAHTTIEGLAGNDLNRFAAVLTQIQLLWHLLPFRREILHQGFPELRIVEGSNALEVGDFLSAVERFTELSEPRYKAVVGNPPYVRPERQTQVLDRASEAYYGEAISAHKNLYALFLYRALAQWCREAGPDRDAGRVAFIIPHAITDAKEMASLRALFAPDGRWSIRELVDLEAIGPLVFDADVVPIIFIAERAAPRATDVVRVRIADAAVVRRSAAGKGVTFDLNATTVAGIPYPELFASDGRIRTRLTERRTEILQKLSQSGMLEDAALRYYVRLGERNRLVDASTDPSVLTRRTERWSARTMLTGGLAFRGTYATTPTGVNVYKGENIISLGLVGEPAYPGANLQAADDPSIWRFPGILPSTGFAIAQIEQLPNATRFDPRITAFTNTATLFVPGAQYADFPFDLLLHSRVYRYAYALGYRMGVLFRRRSHMYPENIKQLPWSDRLLEVSTDLESIRAPLLLAYELVHARSNALATIVEQLGLRTLPEVARVRTGARVHWGDLFVDPSYFAVLENTRVERRDDNVYRIALGSSLFDWIEIENDADLAQWIGLGLETLRGGLINRNTILSMRLPTSQEQADALVTALAELNARDPIAERDDQLDLIDALIAPALRLSGDDVAEIQRDLKEDPFLRSLGLREPFTTTRLLGERQNLARADRYT